MTQGKATATVSGRVVAETNEYEVVEGNIYVGLPFLMTQGSGHQC